jgi:hypothetical protein
MRDHFSQQRRSPDGSERTPGQTGPFEGHEQGHRHHRDRLGEHEGRAFRHGGPGAGRGERGEARGEGRGEGRGRGRGGPRGPRFTDAEPTPVSAEAIVGWLTGRLPDDWFTGAPRVEVDRDEITVTGVLADVPAAAGDEAATSEAEEGRISRFREETRETRMAIAREAEQRYDRRIAWGAAAGGTTALFTSVSVPVMTRLRQPERQVLDTLVDAGVARSRSDALAWCVRLVGRNTDEWLASLREAMTAVERVREQGPTS